PLTNSLKQVSEKYNWDAIDLAINGGEDYCLLFTVDASKFEILQADFKQMLKTNIYQIGSIKDNNFGLQYFNEGEMQDFSGQGFDHFKPK
ncbi:MAG: thiamine-phosphate kinase, partial [Candidatus Marinimicrobia bacterium]|nr:thiamine-phosphate kinase [Candidatus Neomarinimicrobiota bacterium]